MGSIEIIPSTGRPGCVIHFQLPAKHVVTASAAWRPGTDLSWTITRKARGWVASTQGTWRGGRLTATDASADVTRQLGPGPTISSCLATWNAAPPTNLPSTAPAFVQALNGGITIDHKTGSETRIAATDACTVTIRRAPKVARLYARGVARWGRHALARAARDRRSHRGRLGERAARRRTASSHRRAPPSSRRSRSRPPRRRRASRAGSPAAGWAGGLELFSTFPAAVARFGKPSAQTEGLRCRVTWARLGLIATFSLCAAKGRVTGFTGYETWSTSTGLRVGMPESAIEQRYPGARHLAEAGGQTLWYLVPRSGRPGLQSLTATTSPLGVVSSISIGASVESGSDGVSSTGTVVWGVSP